MVGLGGLACEVARLLALCQLGQLTIFPGRERLE
jgi:hypothetical protein